MKNDMKLIMESWRKGQEEMLKEQLLQEGVLDWIKKGFEKLMKVPEKFDAMVEEAKATFQQIMTDKLKNDSDVQQMGKEVAETISANKTQDSAGGVLSETSAIEGEMSGEAEKEPTEKHVDKKELTEDDLRELGLTDEQIEKYRELLAQKAAESVIEAAEEVVGKTAPPAVKDWLVRFIKRSSKMTVFGFIDNFIMITAGDYIDPMLANAMGTSTMFAAGMGNMISDMAGEEGGSTIDRVLEKAGLDILDVSDEQMEVAPGWMRFMDKKAGTFGVAIGCLLGMIPLAFMEGQERKQKKKK